MIRLLISASRERLIVRDGGFQVREPMHNLEFLVVKCCHGKLLDFSAHHISPLQTDVQAGVFSDRRGSVQEALQLFLRVGCRCSIIDKHRVPYSSLVHFGLCLRSGEVGFVTSHQTRFYVIIIMKCSQETHLKMSPRHFTMAAHSVQ